MAEDPLFHVQLALDELTTSVITGCFCEIPAGVAQLGRERARRAVFSHQLQEIREGIAMTWSELAG